jgi:HrpA-like RNA helicase
MASPDQSRVSRESTEPSRRLLSFRVPVDLADWLTAYAQSRSASSTAVVVAALREFRALSERGVPDLAERVVRGASGSRKPRAFAAGRSRPAASARRGSLPGAAPASSSRPVVPAPDLSVDPARAAAFVPLWSVVAEQMGLEEGRARRHCAFRGALVQSRMVRNPDALVVPGEVRVG